MRRNFNLNALNQYRDLIYDNTHMENTFKLMIVACSDSVSDFSGFIMEIFRITNYSSSAFNRLVNVDERAANAVIQNNRRIQDDFERIADRLNENRFINIFSGFVIKSLLGKIFVGSIASKIFGSVCFIGGGRIVYNTVFGSSGASDLSMVTTHTQVSKSSIEYEEFKVAFLKFLKSVIEKFKRSI